jgi:hypothetical protein
MRRHFCLTVSPTAAIVSEFQRKMSTLEQEEVARQPKDRRTTTRYSSWINQSSETDAPAPLAPARASGDFASHPSRIVVFTMPAPRAQRGFARGKHRFGAVFCVRLYLWFSKGLSRVKRHTSLYAPHAPVHMYSVLKDLVATKHASPRNYGFLKDLANRTAYFPANTVRRLVFRVF